MKRMLAVRQDNNGDVILTSPALRALARECDALSLLVSPSGSGAASIVPGVSETIVARTEWIAADPRPIDREATLRLVDRIAGSEFSDAFVFTSWHQSPLPTALLLRLASVKRIHAISADYPGSLLDTRAVVPDDIHEVERNLRLLDAAGIAPPEHDRLTVTNLPERDRTLPGDYVVVQPGASVPARAWTPERNRDLVAALAAAGRNVVVTGAPSERSLCDFVSSGFAAVRCDATFAEYAAIVRDARAIVVGNTAGAHVASAVGTPVVSLFPPTIPAVRFRPWRVAHELLGRQDIACANCRSRVCPIPEQPCLGEIDVATISASLGRLAPEAYSVAR